MRVPGRHPLRRADARGDIGGGGAGLRGVGVPDHTVSVLSLSAARQLAGLYLPCAGKETGRLSAGYASA